MFWRRSEKRFPRRLGPGLTAADYRRMAWAPSSRAPHPDELLRPGAFVPPGPPPMGAEERALLDAVLADPGHEPRLRYADWLDRHGDPARAEFIRVQIALSHEPWGLPPRSDSPRQTVGVNPTARQALVERERELLAEHRERWVAPLAPWAAEDVEFVRGFPQNLSLSGRAFVALGDGLFRTAPVWGVRLVAVAPYLDELARSPHLGRLRRLDLSGNRIGPDGVRELAGSPHLGRLIALDLSGNDLGPDGARELVAAPWHGRLGVINYAGNRLTTPDVDPVVRALADAHRGKSTAISVDLSGNPLGPAAGAALAAGLAGGWVCGVRLESVGLGPDGATALGRADELPATLDLGFNAVGDAGAAALAGSPGLAGARTLVLRGNRITDAGAGALARSPYLGRVNRLDVRVNHLGPAGERELRARFGEAVLLS